jgi:hypothetical protein
MTGKIPHKELERGIGDLAKKLNSLPNGVIQQAVNANAWFTPYYVSQSLKAVLPWFSTASLQAFLKKYPAPSGPSLRIGIITAGNLPWVGLHDVLMTWLAGHKAVIKLSHQDEVLMKWFIEQALSAIPALAEVTEICERPEDIAYLIATGTDNSARYFRYHYQEQPRLIRRNRFSVAIINSDDDLSYLKPLVRDLYLYNGLGCRNVSNLLVPRGINTRGLWEIWEYEALDWLNPLYLEKVRLEQARWRMEKRQFEGGTTFLLTESDQLGPTDMGIFKLVYYDNEEQKNKLIEASRNQIQCVVGMEVDPGDSQQPALDDFADGVDTYQKLLTLAHRKV